MCHFVNPHRRILNLPQIQLSYLEWNQGREPLLLLHGLADCGTVWLSLAASLCDGRDLAFRLRHRYHILAPDLESEKFRGRSAAISGFKH